MKRLILLSLFYFGSVLAIDNHTFANAQQQAEYEALTSELRCLVCQNQTIADSNADLAKDLREEIYQMLQQGKSKADIVTFMTDRYGDFVLYNPPFKSTTLLLWLAPALFLITGLIAIVWFVRTKKVITPIIDNDKLAQAKALLQDESN